MKKNLFALSAFSVAFVSLAQEPQIERITVSGDFRKSTLDQLSSSASVVSENRLHARQAAHIDEILNVAPNVNFASGAARGRFIQIRGIGERSQFAEPINPSVSFIVDEFDFSGLAAAGVLFDTRQVEVYRGPQATLFGSGALAGAIKIASHNPGDDAPDTAEVTAASKDTYRFEIAQGQEITSNINYRAALMHNRSDGFVTNTFLGRDDTDNIDETAARLGVTWSPAEDTQLTVNYRWYDIENGYDAFSLDNDRNSRADEPGYDNQQTHAVSAKLSHTLNFATLSLIATHASHNIAYGFDEDWTYTGFHPLEYSSFDAYFRDIDTQTAEVRLASELNARLFNDTTDWIVGAYYKTSDEHLQRQYTYLNSDFLSEYSPSTVAMYAQTDTNLTDNLVLTVGLRAETYDFDYSDNAGAAHQKDTSMVGGKVALQYIVGSHFWYANISRGYKGAGLNPDSRVSEKNRFYEEEYNWNYEIGVKGPFLLSDLTARAAVFYMERKNTQVSDYDVRIRDDDTPEFIDIIDNADLGTNQGAEVEVNWQATASWNIAASVGYLDATFEDYTTADGTFIEEQQQAQAPEFTANVFSEYVFHDNLLWRLEMDFKDEYRFSDGHEETSPPTTLVNSELVWLHNNWQTSLWVKNAFDRTYYVRGFGGFSNDPREGYATPKPYYQLGDGRQFGVTLRYQF